MGRVFAKINMHLRILKITFDFWFADIRHNIYISAPGRRCGARYILQCSSIYLRIRRTLEENLYRQNCQIWFLTESKDFAQKIMPFWHCFRVPLIKKLGFYMIEVPALNSSRKDWQKELCSNKHALQIELRFVSFAFWLI